ncbi:MAG: sulfotransferase [Dokdonella sp.]
MTEINANEISAAMRSGDWTNVERLARTQLSDTAPREDMLAILAISLQLQNKPEEAVETYTRLTAVAPGESAHWNNYATALRDTGALEKAEAAYRESIRLDSGNSGPRVGLGLLLLARQDNADARDMLLDAFELDRELPLIRIHAARACTRCQDFHGAEDLLRPWRQWLPLDNPPLQSELAHILLLLGDAIGPQLLIEDLVRANPLDVSAKLFLATIYERVNRLDDSQALAASVVATGLAAADPSRREADHVLATLMLRRGDAAGARLLLQQSGPRSEQDASHYFKLAEACDKQAAYEAAMQALVRAHDVQVAESLITSPQDFAPTTPALPASLIEVSADAYRSWPSLAAPDSAHSPVFILGFPRSGTTLLEQMLDAHPGLQSMDENPFFNRLADTLRRHDPAVLTDLAVLRQLDCDELRKRYLVMVSEKIRRRWDARLVDKNPLNMLWLPLIYRLYPAAKHVLAIRHPCDVILSCYMQNFRSSILIASTATLDRLALAYVEAMQVWLRHVAVFQPNVLVSRYEDLVVDTDAQTRRIAAFLELEDASPMLGFDQHARNKGYIATPSYSQVIEPVNRKGMNRWLRYRKDFESVLPIVEPMLRHWGYSTEAIS